MKFSLASSLFERPPISFRLRVEAEAAVVTLILPSRPSRESPERGVGDRDRACITRQAFLFSKFCLHDDSRCKNIVFISF